MASSQESKSIQIQLQGEMFNKVKEVLSYEEQYIWQNNNNTIEYPEYVQGGSQKNFYQNNSTPIGGSFKAALVYKFELPKTAPQYWVFAWHSPAIAPHSTNKVFTKIVYNKSDINWGEIEKELDNSTNDSKFMQGHVMTHFTAPKIGISDFKATIQYLITTN